MIATVGCAFALNPALDVSQYAHTAWRIRDGFPKGLINTMCQTADGYLWLGTELGLFRFDGVKPVAWQPPSGQSLPSSYIVALLPARDGSLWIGTTAGLVNWKDGRLARVAELDGQAVGSLVIDREGSLWAASVGVPTGRLCQIRAGRAECFGEDGSLGRAVLGLHEGRHGDLWVGVANGLWRWKPGPPKFYAIPGKLNGVQSAVATEDGDLLFPTSGAVKKLAEGKLPIVHTLPEVSSHFQADVLLRDRDGGLWIGTNGAGIVHIHNGRTDMYRRSDGLSADRIARMVEDREGNIWVATLSGLDRFRDFAVSTFSEDQGLSHATVLTALSAKDGSVWFSTFDSLNRWNNRGFTVYRERQSRGAGGMHEIANTGVPDHGLSAIFQDRQGRIWVPGRYGAGYVENDRFVPVKGLPGAPAVSVVEDATGNLWIAYQDFGLFRLSPDFEVEQIRWAALGHQDFASTLAADPSHSGLWLGFNHGGVTYLDEGRVKASYGTDDGLGSGVVSSLFVDPDGTLWAATRGGVSRLKDRRVATLTSKNGLPCDAINWVIADESRSLWLDMPCGLVRVARAELDAWVANQNHRIATSVFDAADGAKLRGLRGGSDPNVSKSTDGKLWYGSSDGVNMIDPRHLATNSLPPPVHVEQLIADRKTYLPDAKLSLPALVRDLEIDYTALSLVAPEKNQFRYKLEGYDSDWREAGNRRQAFYPKLSPRSYRFRVAASNNSGVWNNEGASFDFSVEPAYYQTNWFLALCVLSFFAILAAAYRLRLGYVKQQFAVRLEERVGERTRIARELHDTLLQSFQGVLMKLSALSYRLPDPSEFRNAFEKTIAQGRQALTEGRDAVQGLRSSTVVTNALAEAIRTLGKELAGEMAAHPAGPACPEIHVLVEGETRQLAPIVRDEVHRIACEGVRNACLHAEAARVGVLIQYGGRHFRLRVEDNGKGIDTKVLSEGGRPGHHGLPGMHERARLAGGKLSIASRVGAGTEIELTIPASFAYLSSREGSTS